jgi:hypothetical protein
MSPWSAITAIASAIANYFAWGKERQALKNSQKMQAAKEAENEIATADRINRSIARRDTQALRRDLSE